MFVIKTRRTTMTYNKPVVIELDSAAKAIQSTGAKGNFADPDVVMGDRPTNPAYEADE
jgi:hypothetical protein